MRFTNLTGDYSSVALLIAKHQWLGQRFEFDTCVGAIKLNLLKWIIAGRVLNIG